MKTSGQKLSLATGRRTKVSEIQSKMRFAGGFVNPGSAHLAREVANVSGQ
jgi:hypothetical protein